MRVSILFEDDSRNTVEGTEVPPCFAITPASTTHRESAVLWVLTHVPTGGRIGDYYFESHEDVIKLSDAIKGLINWSDEDMESIRARSDFKELEAKVEAAASHGTKNFRVS